MRSGFRLPELSLRVRLLAALVALATVGLVALALVSYGELESYLGDRVDQQVQDAVPAVQDALLRQAADEGLEGFGPGDRPGAGARPPMPGRGSGPGSGPAPQLPPGTYGALLDADGTVVTEVAFGFADEDFPKPSIPDDLEAVPLGTPAEPVTVGEQGGGSEEFRAVGVAAPGGATTVVAVPLADTEATLDRLAMIMLVVSGVILVALALAAWWLVGVGLRPLRKMGEAAGEIAAGDLSRRVEPANEKTEVGRLGLALNSMLAQIEGAFAEREASEARLRQFLADASHELRTPLAAIRGYAELYRMGASSGPGQVDRAMGRIESESTRMTGLVEDLFTLARLDEVREPSHEPVELDVLLADACEDLRATAPERSLKLELPEQIVVTGDADQLRRVFVNLLANAVVHTPEGTPIETSLVRDGDEAVARVRDWGPGLPPGKPEAVFERFWRISTVRSRNDGGAGLGLAIVAAIVKAHGGTAEAANPSGGGALFTVRLPLASALE